MKLITRLEAKQQKLVMYYTGKQCIYGHISERFTRNGNCVGCGLSDEGKQRANKYMKMYRQKDSYKAYQKQYYKNHKLGE